MKTQAFVDNTVNDLRYEIKFEKVNVKFVIKLLSLFVIKLTLLLSETLLFFLERKYILFSETYFFNIPKTLITSAFFFVGANTKKHRHVSAKASNAALVKLAD